MKRQGLLTLWHAGWLLAIAGIVLAGCQGAAASPTRPATNDTFTSQVLVTSFPNALSASNQLVLGMLKLEGTAQAITPEQAKTLLPVAQALQGQVLKSDAEREATWAFIEAQLTPDQAQAIARMQLTQVDLQTWTRDSGPGQGGTGMTPGQGGGRMQGTPGGAPAGMSTRQPQGGNISPEQQAAFRATAQARGGTQRGTGANGMTMSQGNVVLNSLIRLLAQKSAGVTGAPPSGRRGPALDGTPTPAP